MKTDEMDVMHRKTDANKTNECESEQETNNSKNGTMNAVPAVIQTKEEYFDALRVWLQQVQLQQMAYTYFPYYLSSNMQPNPNNMFIPPMPFNQQMGNFSQTGNNRNNAVNRPSFFANNIFQPNRNNFFDNVRQNMQILQQNGGFEYVIAPIWKRFLAEAIDVCIVQINIVL